MDISEAEAICQSLYSSIVDTGERVSAERIKQVCEDLLESAVVKKITAALVGKLCEQRPGWGGPRAQSITNKSGTLAALVKAYDALLQAKRGVKTQRTTRPLPQRITDPGIALQVGALIADLAEAKRQIQSFKGLIETHLVVSSEGTIGPKIEIVVDAKSDSRVPTDVELDSIRSFLKPEHLERFGLELDGKGRLLDGRQIIMEAAMTGFLKRLAQL